MYWLNAPLQLVVGQSVAVTCTVQERLMDFEFLSQGTTCVAGSVLASTFNSLNATPCAVLGLDTIADTSDTSGDSEHVPQTSTERANGDGLIDVIWCPEYSVLRCNDAAWRNAILSDLSLVNCSSTSVLCLGDPLALAPLTYRSEGAHVVVDYADLDDDSEATFHALWDHVHSCSSRNTQKMQFLCEMPAGIVFDVIFWDPVEPGGLLRDGCFEELIASRTKNSRRNCVIAPCCLILWAQGVTSALLDDMTEVKGSETCGFDLSHINSYSVSDFAAFFNSKGVLIFVFFQVRTLQGIDPSLVPACSCTQPFKVSTINASSADILQLIEPINCVVDADLSLVASELKGTGPFAVAGFVYWYALARFDSVSLNNTAQVANGFSRRKCVVLHPRQQR
jgi:hypothetical protein